MSTPSPHTPVPNAGDDAVLAAVTQWLAHAEPVPPAAVDAAYAAFGMSRLDEELAALVFDSADAGLVGMRATETEARLITFSHALMAIDLQIADDDRSLIGQISPPTDDGVVIESDEGDDHTIEVDQYGRFRAEVRGWPIRVRVVGRMVTPWINTPGAPSRTD